MNRLKTVALCVIAAFAVMTVPALAGGHPPYKHIYKVAKRAAKTAIAEYVKENPPGKETYQIVQAQEWVTGATADGFRLQVGTYFDEGTKKTIPITAPTYVPTIKEISVTCPEGTQVLSTEYSVGLDHDLDVLRFGRVAGRVASVTVANKTSGSKWAQITTVCAVGNFYQYGNKVN